MFFFQLNNENRKIKFTLAEDKSDLIYFLLVAMNVERFATPIYGVPAPNPPF